VLVHAAIVVAAVVWFGARPTVNPPVAHPDDRLVVTVCRA
jgi:hypothetical protein